MYYDLITYMTLALKIKTIRINQNIYVSEFE